MAIIAAKNNKIPEQPAISLKLPLQETIILIQIKTTTNTKIEISTIKIKRYIKEIER